MSSELGSLEPKRREKADLSPEQRAKLAARLRGELTPPGEPPIPRRAHSRARASLMQERLWFLQQLQPDDPAYNEAFLLRIKGTLDRAALERSLGDLVERHEVLRSHFVLEDGQVFQVPQGQVPVVLEEHQLSAPTQEDRDAELNALARRLAATPFDLAQAPLLRAHLVELGADERAVVICSHHIVSDGWSHGVMVQDLISAYTARLQGLPPTWAPLPCQFGDYCEWQRARLSPERLEGMVERARGLLAGAPPELTLPSDHTSDDEGDGLVLFQMGPSLRARTEALAKEVHGSPFMVLLAGFAALLSRLSGQRTIVLGTPVAGRDHPDAQGLVGCFINTVPIRIDLPAQGTFRDLLATTRTATLAALEQAELPFATLVERLALDRDFGRTPVYQAMITYQSMARPVLSLPGVRIHGDVVPSSTSRLDLTLSLMPGDEGLDGQIEFRATRYSRGAIALWCRELEVLLERATQDPGIGLASLGAPSEAAERLLLEEWGRVHPSSPSTETLLQAFGRGLVGGPDRVAIDDGEVRLTFRELDERANQIAHRLIERGVSRGDRVAICWPRSAELVTALWGILKAGAAYVPIDPDQPAARARQILEDAGVRMLITTGTLAAQRYPDRNDVWSLDGERTILLQRPKTPPRVDLSAQDLAYVLFTSGSTGRPKGVAVTHDNVVSFFAAMDQQLPAQPEHWLALTSVAFDISVLELLYTSTRGHRISAPTNNPRAVLRAEGVQRPLDFSLFFFAASSAEQGSQGPYRLLLEAAQFADRQGLSAVWTPERHFHDFGGLYPNPSVLSAALAMVTQRVQLRAGSVVAPLHDPLRIAEEWAVVDQLSGGRAAVSFASGWHPNDFVLAPENFNERRAVMVERIREVQALWRGEALTRKNGVGAPHTVAVRPRPRQAELPIWVTASGDPETFRLAGELGANLLTHLLGQNLEQLREKVAIYRGAWQRAGHPGRGIVSVMVHTFIADSDDEARALVRRPMIEYLRTSASLVKALLGDAAVTAQDKLSSEDEDAMLEHAFERYFATSGLFGSVKTGVAFCERLRRADTDDVACLIDFGVDAQATLAALPRLVEVREQAAARTRSHELLAPAELLQRGVEAGATYFQTTPSMLAAIVADPVAKQSLARLRGLLVGGEACPPGLAEEVRSLGVPALNVYGPTEATVWASASPLGRPGEKVTIGRPLAHASFYVCDGSGALLPPGAEGELYIGGESVALGYWGRSELTAERFVPDPFAPSPGARMYRTGDRVRWNSQGQLEFLGRLDRQVKIRGFRIELTEVEAAVADHPDVREAAVIVDASRPAEPRLLAYYSGRFGEPPEPSALRAALRELLPEYMIPSLLIPLPELPRTTSGKLDRQALPLPTAEVATTTSAYVEARTELEQLLGAIWRRAFNLQRVGVHDDFFELGGHSLLAAQLVVGLSDALGTKVPLRVFVEHPTIAGLAEALEPLVPPHLRNRLMEHYGAR
ncbi:MAG: LLM class flavin-dependent oxidoreductase [Deltaproteobacteria bacterium]|nr:LLM class flavin-dependent oxidoreductase [Deltaproteobacteria bacterium]